MGLSDDLKNLFSKTDELTSNDDCIKDDVPQIEKPIFVEEESHEIKKQNSWVFSIQNGILQRYNGSDAIVEIPIGVTAIGQKAFSSCGFLQKITLPNGIQKIGEDAFSDCRNLTSINLPESLIHIGNGAFMNCEKISSITIPPNAILGRTVFWGWGRREAQTIVISSQKHLHEWNVEWRERSEAKIDFIKEE